MAVTAPTPRVLLTTIDAVAGTAAAVLVVLLLVGEPADGGEPAIVAGVRAISALLVVCFCPGWIMLRLTGFGLHSMTLVAAFLASVTCAILISFLLSTVIGWEWRVAGVALAGVTALGAVVLFARGPVLTRTMGGAR